VNLYANYNYALVEVGIDLVILANELKSTSFSTLMSLRVSQGELKPQGARQPFVYILDSFNKFSNVIIDKLLDALPPCKEVHHKIEVVLGMAPLSKAPYKFN
jgi:hypothetical protein